MAGYTFRRQVTVTVNSTTFTNVLQVSGGSIESISVSVPAAKSGTLTTRTDNDTGELTLEASHGIATSDVIDVFWSGGSRRGMTVGTVSGNAVPIDGGSGDNLPVLSTEITCMVPTEVPFAVGGDTVVGIAASCAVPGYVAFLDAEDGDIVAYSVDSNEAAHWISGDGTNPLASETTATVTLSHGSTSAKDMTVTVVFN